MTPLLTALILFSSALVPYLLGSINTGIIVSRSVSGTDIRNYGSGNAGMTNVLRTFGKLPALITLLGDFGKSVLGVLFARWMFSLLGIQDFDGAYVGGLFALLGHIYPLYFGFRGGKGVLTCAGIALVVNPLAFLVGLVVFVSLVLITRYVSLGSIVGMIAFAVSSSIFSLTAGHPIWETLFVALFAALVVWKHRENIKRLASGTESKISLKKKNP